MKKKIPDLDNNLGENDIKQNGWYLIIPRIFWKQKYQMVQQQKL